MAETGDSHCFSALLLAKPADTPMLGRVLVSHGFQVVNARNASGALELSRHERFDLAVYDQEVAGALELAEERRAASLPRVAIGLLPPSDRPLPAARLHFLVRKPIDPELLAKTIQACFAPIAADRRSSFRHEACIETESCLLRHQGKVRDLPGVRIMNFSLTGLCVEAGEMLPQTAITELTFPLPRTNILVHLRGVIMWAHASGRAGVKLVQVDPANRRKLEDWVDRAFLQKRGSAGQRSGVAEAAGTSLQQNGTA